MAFFGEVRSEALPNLLDLRDYNKASHIKKVNNEGPKK